MYKYAKKGIIVPRRYRKIIIYHLQCLSRNKHLIKLDIKCSKGTYIRTIIDDLGELLSCSVHVVQLRRIQVGSYLINRMITFRQLNLLKDIKELNLYNILMSIDSPISYIPTINISNELGSIFSQGKKFFPIIRRYKLVRVLEKHVFIGLGEMDNNTRYITPKRLLSSFNIKEK